MADLGTGGKTDTNGRILPSSLPFRKRLIVTYSDDVCNSDNDNGASSSIKASGSQVTQEKSLAPGETDDGCSRQEKGDEDDRRELSKLKGLGGGMILEAHSTKRSDLDLPQSLKKRKGKDIKGNPPKKNVRMQRSQDERASALAELVKRQRDTARMGSGRLISAATISNPSMSKSEPHSDGEESSWDDGSSDEEENMLFEAATFEDIKGITIPRSKLAKWFMEPFFNEVISGCFVRIAIATSNGIIFRLCKVRKVDATTPNRKYKFANKITCKCLNLVWGNENGAVRWQMTSVSNSPPAKGEFDRWVRAVERNAGHMTTKREVLEKKEVIRRTNYFVYSAAIVKQMVQEKKSASLTPPNIASEKVCLRMKLEMVKDNESEVESIKAKLQELEMAGQAHQEKDKKGIKLEEMNKRNRIENLRTASAVDTSSKGGESEYDRFSRRWTRPTNYYKMNSGGGILSETKVDANASAPAATAGRLADRSGAVDQGKEMDRPHSFGQSGLLSVLQGGFVARKRRSESKSRRKIPDSNGRKDAGRMQL